MSSPTASNATEALIQSLFKLITTQQSQLGEALLALNQIEPNSMISRRQCGKNAQTPAHVLKDYSLVFSDQFNGTLDPAKWNTRYPWGPNDVINGEAAYYPDILGNDGWTGYNPFSFSPDGSLLITAAELDSADLPPTGQQFASGVITTRDSCCLKYGYVEVCVKNACCPDGMWSAVWLLNCLYYDYAQRKNDNENGGTGNDKFNFEIDIMEAIDNFGCDGAVTHAYHYFTGDRTDQNSLWTIDSGGFREYDNVAQQVASSGNVYTDIDGNAQASNLPPYTKNISCNDSQVVGVDWCPEYIHFYVNGELSAGINGPMNIIADQEMYLIINFALGGNYPFGIPPRLPTGAGLPASMEVQWARMYSHPDFASTKNEAA